MIVFLAAAALTIACKQHPLTIEQAKQLALAAPNIVAAVKTRQAAPFFEWINREPSGWRFTINSDHACRHGRACSGLLGHYTVDRNTGEVYDLDAGWYGGRVSSSQMVRLQNQFRRVNCR